MARHSCECLQLLALDIYRADRSVNANDLEQFGNILAATLNAETTEITQGNKQTTTFGNCAVKTTVDRLQLVLSIGNLCPSTWAIGYEGTVTEVTAAAQAAEPHEGYLDSIVPLTFKPDPTQTITVTGPGGAPAYAVDTDYLLTPNGIVPLTGGAITDATPGTPNLEITYTSLSTTTVETFRGGSREWRIFMDGANAAGDTDKPVSFNIPRAKALINPTTELISDGEFSTMEITFDILSDSSVGSSVSELVTMAFGDLTG